MAPVNRKRDWIFVLPLILQWIVFFMVKDTLPQQLATHFTTDEHGKWIANDSMKPLNFMLLTSLVYAFVFVSLSSSQKLLGSAGNTTLKSSWLFKGIISMFLAGLDIMLLINGASSKDVLLKLNTPLLILLLVLTNIFIFFVFRNAMGNKQQRPLTTTYYNIMWAVMHLLVTYVMLVPILKTSGVTVEGMNGLHRFLLGIFAITGNITYNVKPNNFIGIRTPWTLNNETVWKQTHHLAGILFFTGGLAGFILTFFLPQPYHAIILLVVSIGATGIPLLYSYILHRRILHTTK